MKALIVEPEYPGDRPFNVRLNLKYSVCTTFNMKLVTNGQLECSFGASSGE